MGISVSRYNNARLVLQLTPLTGFYVPLINTKRLGVRRPDFRFYFIEKEAHRQKWLYRGRAECPLGQDMFE